MSRSVPLANIADGTVAVGVPVRNGEARLSAAISSIMGQDYPQIACMVSDNHSGDSTRAIAQSWCREDSRISVIENSSNIGLYPNFTSVWKSLAHYPYFKWAAHDDLLNKSFIRESVMALIRFPDAVGAFPTVTVVDPESGCIIDTIRPASGLLSKFPARRIRALLTSTSVYGIYGVYRTERMKIDEFASFKDADLLFVFRTVLEGRVVPVDRATLFYERTSPKSSPDSAQPNFDAVGERTLLTSRLLQATWRAPRGLHDRVLVSLVVIADLFRRKSIVRTVTIAQNGLRYREAADRRQWGRILMSGGLHVILRPSTMFCRRRR